MLADRHRSAGFTLIEIAVVVFIAGLLLSAVLTVITGIVDRTRNSADQAKLESIKVALATFLSRELRLPCPAVITLASDTANDGVEDTTSDGNGACAATIRPSPWVVATGAIPWKTLGLSKESSIDGYANRFTYQVTKTATTLNSQTVSGMLGNITIHSAGLGTAGNQTNNCLVSPSTTNPCAAVVVVVSHGKNGSGAYTGSGLQIPFDSSVTGNDEKENTNADNKFVVKAYSENSSNPYDDKVLSITAGDLLTPLAAQGTLKDWRAKYNEDIRVIKYNAIADAFNAGGMSGGDRVYAFNNFNFATVPNHRYDPWNTQYIFTLLTASVRCASPPSATSVFTITTRGPDGGNSTDDLTVTVTAGEIQEIISKAGCNN